MPFRLFKRDTSTDEFVTIVSGLPRSGTSMMMRMLEAGGLPVMTDHIRVPDDSNPKGYYEFELVKQLKEGNTGWISDSNGKVVKIISALLEYLPPEPQYRIVFMQRNMSEVLASQREMLLRRGEPTDRVPDDTLAELYQNHLTRVGQWLAGQPNIKLIYLHYNQIMETPHAPIAQLCQFLRPCSLDQNRMLSVVESSLYRQRTLTVANQVQQL
jgi:sulfotransferase family protein